MSKVHEISIKNHANSVKSFTSPVSQCFINESVTPLEPRKSCICASRLAQNCGVGPTTKKL